MDRRLSCFAGSLDPRRRRPPEARWSQKYAGDATVFGVIIGSITMASMVGTV
jgi:hypothetical protein